MGSGKYNDIKNINYEWSDDMNLILDKMRLNCIALSDHHKYRYTFYKDKLILFRFPIILLSGINTFVAVGLTSVADQLLISISTSIISLLCGIITSLELYLNFQKRMESELMSHKEYYRLSVEIFKVISLDIENRKVDGKVFLEEKFSTYEKLLQSSNVVEANYIVSTLTPKEPIIIDESKKQSEDDVESQFSMSSLIPTVQSITQPHLYKLKQKNKDMEKSLRETTSTSMARTFDARRNNKKIDEIDKEMIKYKGELEKIKNSLTETTVNSNNHTMSMTLYYEGQIIESNYRERGIWYPGKITEVNLSGTYNIKYDNGDSDTSVPEQFIRNKDQNYLYRRKTDINQLNNDILIEGTRVEVNFKGRGRWYSGIITRKRIDDTFDIKYDNGDVDTNLDSDYIRVLETNRRRSKSPSYTQTYEDIPVGTKVEARYNGSSRWLSGRVTRKNGDKYDIIYDNGDFEPNKDRHMIKIKDIGLMSPIPKPVHKETILLKNNYDINSIIKIQRWYKRRKTKNLKIRNKY